MTIELYYLIIFSAIIFIIVAIFGTISRDLKILHKNAEQNRRELNKIDIAIGELQRITQRALFPDKDK